MKNPIAFVAVACLFTASLFGANGSKTSIKGYYTRLPFDDQGFTGKFADVVVDLPGKGRFIFSREYGYQPYWEPVGGKLSLVNQLIPRAGDGPKERPDKHCDYSNADIVERTANSVKVHWRYAPDVTKLSFVDYKQAYNKAGNPSEFFAEYADEYFTITADGMVIREAKNGCYSLDEWNDPENQFTQKLRLTAKGIQELELKEPRSQKHMFSGIEGEKIKDKPLAGAILNFSFDEALGEHEQKTREQISKTACSILGTKAHWRKGVSGTCLSFDSYSSAVVLPGAVTPVVQEEISVEAWVAPQEYPFSLGAIVDHLNGNSGYLLGMNARGCVEFKVGINNSLESVVSAQVPLLKWTHIVATCGKTNGLRIFINGVLSANKPVSGKLNDATNSDLTIGMTRSFTQFPPGAVGGFTKMFKTQMAFSGLIDEVTCYNREITDQEIKLRYERLKPANDQPLQAWLFPDSPRNPAGFGAFYTHLKYSPEWDGLWRVGKYSDLVVTFEDQPWRFVFWRGTRYLPSLVTDYGKNGIWSSDQSPEHLGVGGCHEHMSDMLCRFSKIRLISSNPARVIVHWRNASVSIDYKWDGLDEDGWGIWTDEYWTIYPDGVAVRHQVVNNRTKATINCEMNQHETLHQPGQPDVLQDDAVIVANTEGETQSWYRSKKEPSNELKGDKNLLFHNFISKTKQFEIGEIGTSMLTFLTHDNYWFGWNHYPVQLIPSDGTDVYQYDRPASTCPTTLCEVRRVIDPKTMEAMVLYGLTNDGPKSLTGLNRSWNFAPPLETISDCRSKGYDKNQRAYVLSATGPSPSFRIAASAEHPIVNLCFVVKNWNCKDLAQLQIDSKDEPAGPAFRQGIEFDSNGRPTLVVWLQRKGTEPVTLTLRGAKPELSAPKSVTWAKKPEVAKNTLDVTMAATVPSGIDYEYLFERVGGGEGSASWQKLPVYTDHDLPPNTEVSYRVKTRDTYLAETEWSPVAKVKTPTPAPVIWNFEEGEGKTIKDSAGQHTGTISGEASWVPGVTGKALHFDGKSYVELSPADDLHSNGNFTWMAWIRTTEGGTILARAGAGPHYSPGGKALFVDNGRLRFDIGWVGATGAETPVADGKWHHVAVVANHDNIQCFVDGVLSGSAPFKVTEHQEKGLPIRIGFCNDDFPKPQSGFVGDIGGVQWYGYALSPDAVSQIYRKAEK